MTPVLMETNPTIEFEYLHNALEELERYLLSDELFWPVLARPSTGGSFLKLTLGNLLLSIKKLDALQEGRQLSRAEEGELRRIRTEIETVQRKWQAAWERKAEWEFRSRFGQWAHVLDDLKKDFERQAPYYNSEVRLRMLLDLLAGEVGDTRGYDLTPLDAFLKGLLIPGRFIWPPELEPGFPEEDFWYLYGGLE